MTESYSGLNQGRRLRLSSKISGYISFVMYPLDLFYGIMAIVPAEYTRKSFYSRNKIIV